MLPSKWRARGKYAIENPHGYTICKTFDAGKALYSGWAPKADRAFIHDQDAAKVKRACDEHRGQA